MVDANHSSTQSLFTGKIRFDYIKSNFFRVVHIDGVHGGVRPSGNTIHMALFSERNAIPKQEEFDVTDGKIGGQRTQDVRPAIVREVEVDAIMDVATARAMRDWLHAMISAIESANNRAE